MLEKQKSLKKILIKVLFFLLFFQNINLSFANNYDFFSDFSITKFVNNKISYKHQKYIPKDLILIKNKYISSTKNIYLRKILKTDLEKLSYDFYKNFWVKLKIVSSYRSYDYQRNIETKNKKCVLEWFCSKAWYSEHQSWLSIDIFETTSKDEFLKNKNYKKYFDWLNKNACKYWFINTYRKWLKVDWYQIEPWHWRYVWINLAKDIYSSNITFAEYYNKFKN